MLENKKEPLTVDDLSRIFIRAQDDAGKWGSFSVDEVNDKQFDVWIRTKITLMDEYGAPWSLEERAYICDKLWQDNSLVMLKKDVKFEE